MMKHMRYTILLTLVSVFLLELAMRAQAMPPARWSPFTTEPVRDKVTRSLNAQGQGAPATSRGQRIIGLSAPTVGTVRLLAIPVAFQQDRDANTSGIGTFPYRTWGPAADTGYLQTRLNRLTNYYTEVSGGRIYLKCTMTQIVTLPKVMSVYHDAILSNDINDNVQIMTDTLRIIDGAVDFSAYDIIVLIHAGSGQEMSLNPDSKDIWSHQMRLFDSYIPTNDGVLIGGYCVVPETECNDSFLLAANAALKMNILLYEQDPSTYPGVFIPHYWDCLGAWAHEVGHAFGFADAYNTNVKLNGFSLEDWSLMASGCYLPGPDPLNDPSPWLVPYTPGREYFGSVPCHPDAWNKKLVGWTGLINVTSKRTNEAIPAQGTGNGTTYRMWTNGDSASKEYFLLESRIKTGYDRFLPSSGLLIYHIDDSVGSIDYNDLQNDPFHPRIKIVPSTNEYGSYLNGTNPVTYTYYPAGDAVFPGTRENTHFGVSTTPDSGDYKGFATYVDVNNIRINGTYVYADLQVATQTTITFNNPIPGSTIYVTKPTIRAVAPNLDPTSIQAFVNGNTVSQVNYDAKTGELSFQLGPLATGTYQVDVRGTDINFNTQITGSMGFTVRAKVFEKGTWMVSLPLIGVGTTYDVFAGQPNYQLATWVPAGTSGSYVFSPDPTIDLADPQMAVRDRANNAISYPPAGKAYWAKLPYNTTLRLAGDITDGQKQYALPVSRGFNMIGNPYNYNISFGSLLIEYKGQIYSITDAARNHLVDPVLYSWDGSGYLMEVLPEGILETWKGYWIYVRAETEGSSLRIIFQPVISSSTAAKAAAKTSRTRGTAANWQLAIKAESLSARQHAEVVLGVLPNATNTLDAGQDLLAPPAAPTGIGLATQNGAMLPLSRDYRSQLGSASCAWNLDVTGIAGEQVVMSWPDMTQLPANLTVTLFDTVTGKEVYLRTTRSYALTMGPQETSRRLIVRTTTRVAGSGLQISNVLAQRNQATNTVVVTGMLSVTADLRLEIRTMTGKLVAVTNKTANPAGTFTLNWDGKDTQGRRVSQATYQCQLTATTPSGQSVKAVTMLSAR